MIKSVKQREAHREHSRTYREANRDKIRASGRIYARRNKERIAEYRKSWDLKHPEKPHENYAKRKTQHRASTTLGRAVRSGMITKPKQCELCGETTKLEGHHEDYSQSLVVKWLCRPCHARIGRK